MRITNGTLLFATGLLHQLVGVVELRAELAAAWRERIVATVSADQPLRMAALWFFAMGAAMMALGAAYRHIETTLRRPLPASAGLWLLALALLVIVPLPESGAWLLLPQAALVFARARANRPAEVGAALGSMLDHASHVDVKSIETNAPLEAFVAGMLGHQPRWISVLYQVRRALVWALGMRQDAIPEPLDYTAASLPNQPGQSVGFFEVRFANRGQAWAAEAADKHLRAVLAVVASTSEGERQLHVVTVVHYKHWTGPVYFNIIRPFHHLVVRAMMRAGTEQAPRLT